jgi:hypothetical protein
MKNESGERGEWKDEPTMDGSSCCTDACMMMEKLTNESGLIQWSFRTESEWR